jgi:hypothetical protein
MSQFAFLQREWSAVFDAAARAEVAVDADPRTACFYARRALELAVSWAYKHDAALRLPYQDNLSALIHEPSFEQTAGETTSGYLALATTEFRPSPILYVLDVHEMRRTPLSIAYQQDEP